MNGTMDKLLLAQTLQRELWRTGIAYGDPPRLWRVSPQWYFLWETQWQQILDFGSLIPALRKLFDGNGEATYLRADFTLNRQGNLVLLELNGSPVWDFGTQAVRQIYRNVLGLGENDFEPFPGAAVKIGQLLLSKFPGQRIVILLGPERVNYQAEYECMAQFLRGLGMEAMVTRDEAQLRAGDVIYRTFAKELVVPRAKTLIEAAEVQVWPPINGLEEKLWMAQVFIGQGITGPANIGRYLPRTWNVDPNHPVKFGKKVFAWSSEELMGARLVSQDKPEKSQIYQWVMKPVRSGQGKGVTFSRLLSPVEWRQELLSALVSTNGGGPNFVLQEEIPTQLHHVCYLDDGGNLITDQGYRVRLCVSYLIERDTVEIIDADATLRNHPLVHGSSDAVIMPVSVRRRR